MKRILLTLGLCLLTAGMSFGQTTLSAGDIVISVYNEDGDDDFSFVLLRDIASGTEIIFTDNGWLPESGSFRDNEGQVTWTATSALSKGIEISIFDPGGSPTTNYGTVSESENGFLLGASSGDQIIAFQGSLASPTPIFMFDSSTNGIESTDAEVNANEDSGLPTGLTEGANAYVVGSASQDNFQYNCPAITDATASNIRASFMNSSNYTTSTTTTYSSVGCNFRDTIISGSSGWRMLSFPISGGAIEDISDDTAIQGVSGGDNTGETSNFQTYDNTGSYETPVSVSTNLLNGYGFITYFYNNTDAGSETLPITLDASGLEPSSDVSVDLNISNSVSSSYFTMIGNPYATNFNLNSITVTGGTIQNNVAFWDNGASSYSAEDRTTPYIVEPWQGLWVESADAATSISMPTSGKTTSSATGTFFSKENPNSGDINFTLSSENTFDKAIRLSARPDAIIGYDVADASKFTPLLNSFATMAFVGKIDNEDKLQSVFSVPSNLEDKVTIPLRVNANGVSGEFAFAWENLDSISDDWEITLTDHETGTNVSLREVDSYTFMIEAAKEKSVRTVLDVATVMESDDTSINRFSITIAPNTSVSNEPDTKPTAFALNQNYPNPFNPSTTISYSVGQTGPVNITVYNVMGQKVAELVNATKTAGNNYQVSWDATAQASGIYYYRLTAPGQVLTRQMTLIK